MFLKDLRFSKHTIGIFVIQMLMQTFSTSPKLYMYRPSLTRTFHCRFFPIESISYGVQDLVYTRVFAMIVVKEIPDRSNESVFECHAFVCDSRQSARKLTYSLATAFHRYSRQLRAAAARPAPPQRRKLFAIDLRTPEEIARQTKYQDSEA